MVIKGRGTTGAGPILKRFFEMKLVTREIIEWDKWLWTVETRRDPKTKERQRLTYRLDEDLGED